MSKVKLVLLDLDNTLVYGDFPNLSLFPDTIAVLDYLKTTGVKIVLASHNQSAEIILRNLNISSYFDIVLGYYDYTNKFTHLNLSMQLFGVKSGDIILFDDLYENIYSMGVHGAQSFLVDPKLGIQLKDVISLV